MKENVLRKKCFVFAVRIVRFCRVLRQMKIEWPIVYQLIRCGTSIAANVEEANAAISKREFSAKLSIAFKEARETRFWLCLIKELDPGTPDELQSLLNEIEEILRILWAILKKTRIDKMKNEDNKEMK